MKRMIKYPSIEQFRTIIKNVQKHAQFVEYNEETKEVIVDRNIKLPKVTAVATEKIHGCFEKNTLITLANGEEVPISKLEEGVYILSYNHETEENEYKKVKKVINQKMNKEWCKLVFDKTEIICTKDHKIWTKNRGYVEAFNLTSDDIFKTV